MEMKDFLEAKALLGEGQGLSQYEQIKVNKMSRKPSGVAIAGLTIGCAGVVGVLATAILTPMYSNAKAKQAKQAADSAKEVSMAYISGIDKRLDNIGALLETEVNRRIAGDLNITNTINDTVSGSQQGQLSQSQQLSNEIALGVMTGEYERRPQRVALYRDQQACDCPQSGCGSFGCNR